MSTALAVAGVVVWLLGVVGLAVLLPHAVRKEPMAQLALDLAPAVMCAVLALLAVAWPALPVYAAVNKITERRTR